MASQQIRRENKSDEQEDVPKLSSHLESLTVVGDQQSSDVQRVVETMPGVTGDQVRQVMDAGKQPGSTTVVHQVVGTISGGDSGRPQDQSKSYKGGQKGGESGDQQQYKYVSVSEANQSAGDKAAGEKDLIVGKSGQTGQQQMKGSVYGSTQLAGQKDREKGTGEQQTKRNQTQKNRPPGAPQTNFEKGGQQIGDRTKKSISGASQTAVDQKGAKQSTKKNDYGAPQTVKDYPGANLTERAGDTAEYAGKAAGVVKDAALVSGWGAAELAINTAEGVKESMENINAGVGTLIEGTAMASEIAAEKALGFTGSVADAGKKGASYVGEKAIAGKDVTSKYAGKAMGMAKDSAAGVTEAMENLNAGVGILIDDTAMATEIVLEKTIDTGKTTAEFSRKAAGVAKDAAIVGGWSAAEFASDTTAGVKDSVDNLNVGVAGLVEGAAVATEVAAQKALGLADTVVDAGIKGVLKTGRTTAEYGGKVAGVVKDAALVAGWSAGELASGTTVGLKETMGDLNAGVGGLIEGAAVATEITAEKAIGSAETVVGAGKKGVGYIGEKAVAGKDITMESGKNAAEYAAGVLKDTSNMGEGESGVSTIDPDPDRRRRGVGFQESFDGRR